MTGLKKNPSLKNGKEGKIVKRREREERERKVEQAITLTEQQCDHTHQ